MDMKHPIDMHRLARLGAVARLKELEEEATAIRKAFPGLSKGATPVAATPAVKPAEGKKRNLTPEARQAARERMTAYWARKRAEQASLAAAEPTATEAAAPTAAKKRTARKAKGKKKA
jgi:hypothetical protein